MNRIDRLLGILTHLQSKKYVPAEKIAEKFSISVRTVYRDIKALGELGIPVSFEPTRGYFVVQGYFLPPVSFTTEEAHALLVSEVLAQGFADRSTQKHLSAALQKVKAVLRSSQKDTVETLDTSIRMQMHPNLMMNVDYISSIQQAIGNKQILLIEYKDAKDATTERRLEPIGLVFYAFSWHLIGWCHSRKDYRDFKLTRITHLRNLGLPFTHPGHIEMSEYMKSLPVDY